MVDVRRRVVDPVRLLWFECSHFRYGNSPGGGGGGVRGRYGYNPKRGVLGTGTSRNGGGGGFRYGHNSEKEGLKNWSCKKDDLTNVAQKGGLGAYLLITFIFFLSK